MSDHLVEKVIVEYSWKQYWATNIKWDIWFSHCALPNSNKILHVILGDEAFRLHKNILKPYKRNVTRQDADKAVFNYRLSRTHWVTENAFGFLSQIFRMFYTTINPETCDNLVIVACCLHNMLRDPYLEIKIYFINIIMKNAWTI